MWEEVKIKGTWNSTSEHLPHTLFPHDRSSCFPGVGDIQLYVTCFPQQLGLWNLPPSLPSLSGINNRWLLLNCAPVINQTWHFTNCFKFLISKLERSCNLSVCCLDSPCIWKSRVCLSVSVTENHSPPVDLQKRMGLSSPKPVQAVASCTAFSCPQLYLQPGLCSLECGSWPVFWGCHLPWAWSWWWPWGLRWQNNGPLRTSTFWNLCICYLTW